MMRLTIVLRAWLHRLAVAAGEFARPLQRGQRRFDLPELLVELSQLVIADPEVWIDGDGLPAVLEPRSVRN
jgi:hypothetical protein